jgi:hypothetical protein
MLKKLTLFAAASLLASCAGAPSEAAPPEATAAAAARQSVPTGAVLSPEGWATITHAPPAPFTPSGPSEPGPPPPLTPEQIAANEQFRRAGEFQNKVMDEVQTLAERLRRAEGSNFVDLYFENEGEPHVVFRFLRDPQATLARYTKNSAFRAARAGFSQAELKAAMDFMLNTFREDRVVQSAGMGNKAGRVEVDIAISEAEFRELVARKGVKLPEAVDLRFRATEPASVRNRPLPAVIAPLVRIFPRNDRGFGALHAIDSRLKVVLDAGCFRVAGGAHAGALVLFPLGAQLFVDREGYLAYGVGESPGYARVGEELVFPGSIGEVTAPELVKPIHAACGTGKVVAITAMQSAAAQGAQAAVSQNASAFRFFQENYGLSEAVARRAVERCKERSPGGGTCMLTPPPPPPVGGPSCPPGTKPSFGMCRTPEGYVRPLPAWIEELMGTP